MATGYLVTLGDESLDAGDYISGTQSTFAIDSTLGTGQWSWSGVFEGDGQFYSGVTDTGTYYTGTDGNVYFIPDTWFTTSGDASVVSAPAYTSGPVTVDGTTGDDLINSDYIDAQGDQISNQAESVSTGDGDDTITGSGGADTINGGAGLDIVDYADSDAGVDVNLDTNSFSGGDATGDTATGLDGIIGSAFNDTLTGFDGELLTGGSDDYTNILDGGAGDDVIDGMAGRDSLYGGVGDDTILGGDGADYIEGDGMSSVFNPAAHPSASSLTESSFDLVNDSEIEVELFWINESGAPVSYSSLAPGETVTQPTFVGHTWYIADANTGAPLQYLGAPADGSTITYAQGNDSIDGGDGDDTILAGGGDDTVDGGTGNDSIDGGAGNDLIDGGTGQDTLFGGAGQDTLVSTGFNDSLDGGADADLFDIDQLDPAGSMNLTIDGGSTGDDNDTLDISGLLADGWTITNLTQNPETAGNPGFSGQIQLSRDGETAVINYNDIENFIMPDFVVDGTSGDDTIDASYTGDPDGDRIDNFDHSDGSNADSVLAGDGDDVVRSGDGDDTIYGGDGADHLDGDAGDDQVFGEAGNDSLFGNGGFDSLDGGDGDDRIWGGADNDTLIGGAGADNLFGETGDDSLLGGTDDDTIDGGSGDDTMLGQSGDDTFLLGDNFGNDSITGGETGETDGDTLDMSAVTTNTTVDLSGPDPESGTVSDGTSTATFTEIENIILGSGDDTYIGSSGSDTVIAGDGNDSLDGGAGADSLDGGAGDDTIIVDQGDTALGGDGDDTFILQDLDTTGTGNDPITIVGGEGGETNGDTLILTPDVTQSDITFSSEDDAAGGLSGSFTMADGTFVQFSEIENIICFTPGTNILTQHGERPIETLRLGDMVVTRDHGLRPIRWIGKRSVRGHGDFAPVRIGINAMDGARCGLLVSPQHRILFTGYRAELLFGESEVLVPAKHLIDGQEVVQEDHDEVTYIHIMFDSHEVIYADGIATESFHAGDVGLSAICEAAREELFAIFPELRSAPGHHLETARTCLKRHEARLLVHQTGKDTFRER